MLCVLITAFLLYSLVQIYLEILELNFIKTEAKNKAVVLDESEYKKAAAIGIENHKFKAFSVVYDFFVVVFWLGFGLKFLYQNIVVNGTVLENLAFVMSFILINSLLSLPLEIYSKFVKDKKFGFSNMTVKIFIIDTLKTLVITLIAGSIMVWLLILCVNFLGSSWWIWAGILSFIIVLAINFLYPTLIAPMFNKMSPLEDDDLRGDIERLLNECGFKSSGIFTIDASKRDNRLNAYFGGLGSSKRVVLFDTLIKKLSRGEILAVLGHELGHFKHGDIKRNLLYSAVMIFMMFFIFGNLPTSVFQAVGVAKSSGSIIVMLMILSTLLGFIATPVLSTLSRKKEFAADKHGADIQNSEDMVSALKKLGSENKAFPKSHKLYSAIYHSHPTLFERIEELEGR
ncbi:M48 family metallopeptidase [Campylobacter corcagiensis]|uniref:M48 family metallopeptidase n=1 Tax=Campylobacter corcagiensis TaxID=1448857 RepID=A0A7M1LGY2_9BACT|nr:M48 family metallopeptidase [Campylobacter corcagiensis]QKF65100.1 peptidase, M48 family [Campylobacter corcagiensis]QOQ86755.1 M48 family metallopeptidase [Campylobacter corcagiensis]